MLIKVLSVIGTRPEAIKMAPVINELKRHSNSICSIVCSTGQHREMLRSALSIFNITPDIDLDVMTGGQSLSGLTASLLNGLDKVIQETQPNWVVAQGDTTTVFVAGLVSYYHNINFAHVEAGLRTGNKRHPFPEEINRRFADLLADVYFAPTESSKQALLNEGCNPDSIFVTGNTVVDALLEVSMLPFTWEKSAIASIKREQPIVLLTAHRRESFGDAIRDMCLAIRKLAEKYGPQGYQFVYPVHLNPNVRLPVTEILSANPHINLLEPLDYITLVNLMKQSSLILTDSGGIQEEAPTFNVPVLVMRETTERPEGVASGVVKLIGTDFTQILSNASELLESEQARQSMRGKGNPMAMAMLPNGLYRRFSF
jgi:UDP-N-acetylglucosamine 2-epimerase (non-hydrolysing)